VCTALVLVSITAVPAPVSAQTAADFNAVLNARPANGDLHKISHIVFIMQENRSFDNYFGAYPGADGISFDQNGIATACLPAGDGLPCIRPHKNNLDINGGGPHDVNGNAIDIDGGAMDGFQLATYGFAPAALCPPTTQPCTSLANSVLGFHDAQEIPNYWSYADNFVLQDRMFQSVSSWSAPIHASMLSGWSATCTTANDPYSCQSTVGLPEWPTDPIYAQTDITYLLHKAGVSWNYYVTSGLQPDCQDDSEDQCVQAPQAATISGKWNPLPRFSTVQQDNELANIKDTSDFYTNAANGTLPAVSWVIPNQVLSEHPPASIHAGQDHVTSLINAAMSGPDWNSTAVFVSWDDWGGFYDHVVPPASDQDGVGMRVPGLLISPYAKQGYIDHQTLTFDSYLRFIEDDFLGGQRIDPSNDGRPDPRVDVRELSPFTGDLRDEFDFTQAPRKPMILPTSPAPGPGWRDYKKTVTDPATTGASSQVTQTTTPLSGSAPFDVIFSGAGSSGGASQIQRWHLDFGDGTGLDGKGAPTQDINHRYTTPGSYLSKIKVFTNLGVSTISSRVRVNVTAPSPRAWVNGPSVGVAPFDATYDLSSSDPGHWVLSFDDGSPDVTGDGVEPSAVTHHYATTGYHTVRLSVTDSQKRTATAASTVRLNDPSAPFIRSYPPQLTGADYAYLDGGIAPHDSPTTWWFEWGPTKSYGNTTPQHVVSDDRYDAHVPFTAITGLNALTTYHYRLVAQNSVGTTYSKDHIVTTTGAPIVGSGRVTNLQPRQALLLSGLDPRGSPTTYHFEWGVTTAYGLRSADQNAGFEISNVQALASQLFPGAPYHWRLVATNVAGTTYGPDQTFTTPT
jgi:phospholipase C